MIMSLSPSLHCFIIVHIVHIVHIVRLQPTA
jgi:hypothetical protein